MSDSSRNEGGIKVDATVIKGRDLAAKDKNAFGKRTSSDPYVKVYYNGTKYHRTKTLKRTVNPEWNENFNFSLGIDEVKSIKAKNIKSKNQIIPEALVVRLFDEDHLNTNDPMGTIRIPLDLSTWSSTKWYPVGKGKGKFFTESAKGEVQLKISVTDLDAVEKRDRNLLQPENQNMLNHQSSEQENATPQKEKQEPVVTAATNKFQSNVADNKPIQKHQEDEEGPSTISVLNGNEETDDQQTVNHQSSEQENATLQKGNLEPIANNSTINKEIDCADNEPVEKHAEEEDKGPLLSKLCEEANEILKLYDEIKEVDIGVDSKPVKKHENEEESLEMSTLDRKGYGDETENQLCSWCHWFVQNKSQVQNAFTTEEKHLLHKG